MAQAYVFAGDADEGMRQARGFAARAFGLEGDANPDFIVRQFSLLSVDDARALRELASLAPVGGADKVLVIAAARLFHEAQNALLKLFEEPPEDTTLVLVVPTLGILLSTMRSRLASLPEMSADMKASAKRGAGAAIPDAGADFLAATPAAREKLVEKLLARAKSDDDAEKQAVRADALRILEALERRAHEEWVSARAAASARAAPAAAARKTETLARFLRDLDRFIPILHERAAPLKQIFEHVLIVLPSGV